jgi:O-antigen/teichoic acid export membrane protein/glycosyltransferase involved in cell wall biosynthesis
LKPFDTNGAFKPIVPSGGDELRQTTVRSAGITVLSGGIGLAIQVVATVVLARVLSPKDFGLVAMVTTFSLLLVNMGLNGLTEAVVQREEIDHRLASNLFWINLGAGLVLTIAFAAAGSLLALFYHEAEVKRVAIGISLTIFITSTSVLHLALLKRAMRFGVVSANDIVARFASVVVSIVLGFAGWGYWALIGGAVTLPLSTAIGAWWSCRWLPSRPRRVPGTGSMLQFAIATYGRFSFNYFARNTDNLLVGWRFNAQALGFYKKAYDLFALSAGQLVSSISVVAVSALSRVNRDTVQYRRSLLGTLTVVAFVGMGLSAFLTLAGKDLIRLLLGPSWAPAGQIFTYFGPGIGIMMVYYTHGWIHLSIGRADRWFRWGAIEFAVTFLLFLVGLPWGPVGIAVAWTASFWLLTIPAIWYAGRPIEFSVGSVVSVTWKYVLASLIAGSATYLLIQKIPFLAGTLSAAAAAVRILTILSLSGTLYLGAVVILHGGAEPIHRMVALLREMVPAGALSRVFHPVPASRSVGRRTELSYQYAKAQVECTAGPLVSILIPAFNAEEWIADTLRSALAQTWEPKEIIVVDDGSSDETLAIARQFESNCVRVFTQKNQGAAAARNNAFSLSHGDYIQWLDADDLLAPDKVARQMEELGQCRNKRELLSSAWGLFMYRHYRAEFVPTELWCDLSPVEWLLRKMGQNLYMQSASWLVSRELTEAAGPWDTRLLSDDDGEYFCRVLLASDGVRFVPESKVYYRGPGLAFRSLSYIGRSTRKLDAHWLSMQLHIGYLRSLEDSERARAACLRYLQTSLIYFYPENRDIVKQAELMAIDLGGELGLPSLSWKYSWMKTILGWRRAKHGQQLLLSFRWWLERVSDKALFRIEGRKPVAHFRNLRVEDKTL